MSRLTPEQAIYHFYSGYTSKIAGTEQGVKEPTPTFSACFGEAFMPMSPQVYADLLFEKIQKHNVKVWLVNTGWTGGRYGVGRVICLFNCRELAWRILEILSTPSMAIRSTILKWKICPSSTSHIQQRWKEWIRTFSTQRTVGRTRRSLMTL